MDELNELKLYAFATGDGRRFWTVARNELSAISQVLERFPQNRAHDAPLREMFKIVESPLDSVIEERLTTHITVLQ
jgi:hypothetical protein